MINDIIAWLTDPAHVPEIVQRTEEHLVYSVVSVAIAAAIAIPAGLWVGHTGRGRFVVVNLAGAARAIPSLGLLYFIVLWLSPQISGDLAFVIPNLVVLVVLAIPPLLSGAYAGVEEVDPAARDAARGMGMRGWQVLFKVEVPCSLPLLFSGLRSAFLQVIATATIAATAALGGLGRFLIDGLSVRDYPQMASGAVLVAVLAILVDLALALAERLVTSPGVTRRFGRRPRWGRSVLTPDSVPTVTPDPENVGA